MILLLASNVDSVTFSTVRSLSRNKDCDFIKLVDVTESTFSLGLFSDEPKTTFVNAFGAKIGDIRHLIKVSSEYPATIVIYTDYPPNKLSSLEGLQIVDLNVPDKRHDFIGWALAWTEKYGFHQISREYASSLFNSNDNFTEATEMVVDYSLLGIIYEENNGPPKYTFVVWDLIDKILSGPSEDLIKELDLARKAKKSVSEIVSVLTSYFSNVAVVGDKKADHSEVVKNSYYHSKNYARIKNKKSFYEALGRLSYSKNYDELLLALIEMASAARNREL